ncbi:DEAD/DEAH box helicase family protein [Actinocatenispora sera]|uniref:DEAD/DEAH box helicase family protein n=1 Tax=Actinocatenispora sera TaxID=390989 RepID=UPI0033CB2468
MDRRSFSDAERVALFIAADGKCSSCGIELQPGWHADHVAPWSKGGPTDVINGQALCPSCNLKKGSSTVPELREWQKEAMARFLSTTDDFLCVATPGAGKTRFALAAARELMRSGDISQIIVVAPTAHLRNQWASAASSHAGIELDSSFANGTGAVARDFDGVVVTYASVASAPHLYRRMATVKPTMVILDEVHHGGDEKAWGTALRDSFEHATRRLLLSGTPFRSDGAAIPFLRYDESRRCVADYSYDYGAALADRQGVVRPIAFPAFDGEARWLDASLVESKQKLSDVDAATRARALMSALMPDGPWISSVLNTANEELSRQRELVPDAGGLVVAADQNKAVRYASLLEQITGEKPTVAISDIPDASHQISAFSRSTSRWIVAVAMVSEGVDIPRLAVGVYATNTSTEMFFRQVAGRFVRTRGEEDETCATLFIPSVQPLLGYAAEIERMIPLALKEAEIKAAEEVADGSGTTQLEINIVQPLAPSEAVHLKTILSGDEFSEAELKHADEVARQAGMPATLTAPQVARLLRIAGAGRTLATTTATVEVPQQALVDQKKAARKLLKTRINYLARLTNEPHSYINNGLNQRFGGIVPTADLDGLKKRVVAVEEMIREAKK